MAHWLRREDGSGKRWESKRVVSRDVGRFVMDNPIECIFSDGGTVRGRKAEVQWRDTGTHREGSFEAGPGLVPYGGDARLRIGGHVVRIRLRYPIQGRVYFTSEAADW